MNDGRGLRLIYWLTRKAGALRSPIDSILPAAKMMESKDNDPIAVIGKIQLFYCHKNQFCLHEPGMGCRFSGGANGPEALWSMLSEGRSAWTKEVPPDRFNLKSFYHPNKDTPGAIAAKGAHFLDQHLAAFDAGFFAMPSMEAEALDPQQRVVLEVAWEALENAGVKIDKLKGSDTAVFSKSRVSMWKKRKMKKKKRKKKDL